MVVIWEQQTIGNSDQGLYNPKRLTKNHEKSDLGEGIVSK